MFEPIYNIFKVTFVIYKFSIIYLFIIIICIIFVTYKIFYKFLTRVKVS